MNEYKHMYNIEYIRQYIIYDYDKFFYSIMQPKRTSSYDYDSDNEDSDTDDDEDYSKDDEYSTDVEDDGLIDEQILKQRIEEKRKKRAKLFEHFDTSSYPWLIMQLALVEITIKNINDFISLAGFELSGRQLQQTI